MQFLQINMLLGCSNINGRAVIIPSAAASRRQRGAGMQRYGKPPENNKSHRLTPQRIPTHTAQTSFKTKEVRPEKNTIASSKDRRLTESKLTRAKMAKVEMLSHTHLVLNEWTGTALQLRADQDPSREELHREGERKDALGEESSDKSLMRLPHLSHMVMNGHVNFALCGQMYIVKYHFNN